VTAAYNAATDRVELTSSGPLMIGAANDTSNFLGALRLTNNVSYDGGTGTYSTASSSTLGTVKLNSPLAAAGLRTNVPGAGSFSLNGVTIAYDGATDSLSTVLARINASAAGVTATYDVANDRVALVNNKTGDFGIALGGDTGGLLGALGLTGATFVAGQDAEFTVNGGPVFTSASNTLDTAAHGIAGLSVTVNSETTQTLDVVTDGATAFTAIQNFIEKFNAVQTLIDTSTKVTSVAGKVTTSILSDNREVDKWADQLRALAFGTISGLSGSVKRLDDLGIDFNGISGQLTIKDSDKLSSALLKHPEDVEAFFLSGDTGLVSKIYGFATSAKKGDVDAQNKLTKDNLNLDTQIADIQRRLDSERERLTTSFLAMQSAQSLAQSQNTYLTNTFFKNTSS
jgi:flagellar hook-associated protein 2